MCSQGLQYVPRQRNSIVPTVRQGKAFTDVYGNKCCYLWKNKTAAPRHKKYTCVHSRILLPDKRTAKQTARQTQQVDSQTHETDTQACTGHTNRAGKVVQAQGVLTGKAILQRNSSGNLSCPRGSSKYVCGEMLRYRRSNRFGGRPGTWAEARANQDDGLSGEMGHQTHQTER